MACRLCRVIASLDPTYERACGCTEEDATRRLIDAAAKALGAADRARVEAGDRANLQVTLRLAAVVAEFELPDEAEPAPVFEA